MRTTRLLKPALQRGWPRCRRSPQTGPVSLWIAPENRLFGRDVETEEFLSFRVTDARSFGVYSHIRLNSLPMRPHCLRLPAHLLPPGGSGNAHGLQVVAATVPKIAGAYRRSALFLRVGALLAMVMPRLARAVRATPANEGLPHPIVMRAGRNPRRRDTGRAAAFPGWPRALSLVSPRPSVTSNPSAPRRELHPQAARCLRRRSKSPRRPARVRPHRACSRRSPGSALR